MGQWTKIVIHMENVLANLMSLETNVMNLFLDTMTLLIPKVLLIISAISYFRNQTESPKLEKIRTDFWMQKNIWFRPFFDLFSNIMDQKNARSQKSC